MYSKDTLAWAKVYSRQIMLCSIAAFAMSLGAFSFTRFSSHTESARGDIASISSYPWQPDDLKLAVEEASVIALGTIEMVYEPQWATTNGKAPTEPEIVTTHSNSLLRTPVLLKIEEVYKGDKYLKEVVFSTIGGIKDGHQISVSDNQELTPGTKVVIFLGLSTHNTNEWTKISPYYPQLLYIVNGTTLQGPISEVDTSFVMQQLDKYVP